VEIAIYGGGGFAREVAWLIEDVASDADEPRVACFIDDDSRNQGKVLNGYPLVSLDEAANRYPHAKIICGIGSPSAREKVVAKASEKGFEFATLIHPRVERSKLIEVGEGTVICAGSILTVNVQIKRHVLINLDCTIGHDVIIDDYTALAPGVHVSGQVHFGKRVFVGTGAVIINGTEESPLMIGDDAIIGAGACVINSVPPVTTVVGIPARPVV
jgi:sugar O-acyltransferase (sialic acid O-acetyltransferase NeuD family)